MRNIKFEKKEFTPHLLRINYHLFRRKQFLKGAGFTIIEMLVTLSIITLLTTMVLVYSRQSERATNLIRDSDKLMYELRRAQNLAMLTLQPTATTSGGSANPICGWGIYFNKSGLSQEPQTQYILFSDFCNIGNPRNYDPGEEFEVVKLLKGVEIFKSNVDAIVFVPPEPTVVFSNFEEDDEETDSAFIRIRLSDATNKPYYKIRVTQAGQISKILKDDIKH